METMNVTTEETMVKMVFDSWNKLLKEFDQALDAVTDEQLQKPIAPGKNRGIYVLGHMVAVHDDMLPILGFGDRIYPEINKVFLDPDDPNAAIPSASELRSYWKRMNEVIAENANRLQASEWFERHNSVSAEDFATQPHRNKLNVMITRACHVAHHLGQIKLIS